MEDVYKVTDEIDNLLDEVDRLIHKLGLDHPTTHLLKAKVYDLYNEIEFQITRSAK